MTTWTEAREFVTIAALIDAAVILALWAVH